MIFLSFHTYFRANAIHIQHEVLGSRGNTMAKPEYFPENPILSAHISVWSHLLTQIHLYLRLKTKWSIGFKYTCIGFVPFKFIWSASTILYTI